MVSIVYWNIGGEYGLEENENDRANILWDFQAHVDKLLKAKYEKQFIVLKHRKANYVKINNIWVSKFMQNFKSAKMFDIDFTQFHWLYFIIAHSEMHFINLSHLKIPIGENVKFFLNIIFFKDVMTIES